MSWSSKTEQFNVEETFAMQVMPAHQLARAALESDPIVALRILAELLLNGETNKLTIMLRNQDLNDHWQKFEEDWQVDDRDRQYAEKLKAMLRQSAN